MAATRRALLAGLGSALALPALGQSWPARPIRLLVGYPAGGANDIVMRGIAAPLGDALGQPVTVENRAGAAGGIAAEAAARAAPDGYTLFSISSAHVLAPFVRKTPLSWDPVRDFQPVALGARSPYFLMAHKDFPARSVQEFVAYVKSRPPGSIAYASSGVGAGPHLATSLFMYMAGITLDHVPYRGDADALIDLTTGRVPTAILSVAPALPHLQAGSLRALAVTGTERLSIMPNLPTIAESGYTGYTMDAWWGISGPAGMPAPIVERIASVMRPILDAPAFAERFATLGIVPGKLGTEAFTQLIRSDTERFRQIVRDARIEPKD
jgi:tripartite-type tricarboxylate transporter receptor subunit TctC